MNSLIFLLLVPAGMEPLYLHSPTELGNILSDICIRYIPKKIGILLNIASFFSWNTPKFFSCPVDAENGFKLDDWINMKNVMKKNKPKISPIS